MDTLWLFVGLNLVIYQASAYNNETRVSLALHPDSSQQNSSLCSLFPASAEEEYIVSIKPEAGQSVRKIVLFGCRNVSESEVWNCPVDHSYSHEEYVKAHNCDGETLLYVWTTDSQKFTLPTGAGIRIGGDSGINFLFLEVHYAGSPEDSGIILTLVPGSSADITRSAGTLVLVSQGDIPAESMMMTEAACEITAPLTIHPFAYVPMTREFGRSVSAWKVTKGNEWTLFGAVDPRLPLILHPTESQTGVGKGDRIASRCVFENRGDYALKDEECRMYVMYFTEGKQILTSKTCTSPPGFNLELTDGFTGQPID